MSYPEPTTPHFSFRGFVFLVWFCVLCFGQLMPHDKPSVEAWLMFIATVVYCIFMEVWAIRNPRPEDNDE